MKSVIIILALLYLLYPSPIFPTPPDGVLKSAEPGDLETTYRRSYYTNYSRSQIIDHYAKQFFIPGQILLDLPPEDSFAVIRDQTHTSWLQQFIHPLRESIYINGFYPTKPTEQIYIDDIHYLNKITVRYVPSHPAGRISILALILVGIYFLKKEYVKN
jgi:hypothetical protein